LIKIYVHINYEIYFLLFDFLENLLYFRRFCNFNNDIYIKLAVYCYDSNKISTNPNQISKKEIIKICLREINQFPDEYFELDKTYKTFILNLNHKLGWIEAYSVIWALTNSC